MLNSNAGQHKAYVCAGSVRCVKGLCAKRGKNQIHQRTQTPLLSHTHSLKVPSDMLPLAS